MKTSEAGRAIDRLGHIARHEAGVMNQHLRALRERWTVARKARGAGELLRDQFDLLPATWQRLAQAQARRMQLWRRLARRFDSPA